MKELKLVLDIDTKVANDKLSEIEERVRKIKKSVEEIGKQAQYND